MIVIWLIGFLFSGCGITLITILHKRRKERKKEKASKQKKERELVAEAQKKLWGKPQAELRDQKRSIIIPTPEEITEFSEQQAIISRIKEARARGEEIIIKIAYRYSLKAEDWRQLCRLLWYFLKYPSLKYKMLSFRFQILRGFIEPILKSIW